jgi:hypothetical protein
VSTLDVTCGRCEKRFRVRAEFAGRSTRCPGCSAPITIGAAAAAARPAPPPRAEPDEHPRPRPLPRDEDDEPRRPAADWKPVDTALGREQAAVLFLLATFVSSFVVWGIGSATEGMGGAPSSIVLVLMLLLMFGPSLAAGVLSIAARIAALRAPAEALAKGSAVSSLLCGIGALGSLVVLGLAVISSIESHRPEPMIVPVAVGGALVAGLGALATFVVFVAQVGIARKSDEVSRAFGRTAVAVCVCVLGPLALSFFLALVSALSGPSYYGPGSYGYHQPNEELYLRVIVVLLMPLGLAAILILYHRLLAAGRRALQAGPAGRSDG